jgi:hypothetical protein
MQNDPEFHHEADGTVWCEQSDGSRFVIRPAESGRDRARTVLILRGDRIFCCRPSGVPPARRQRGALRRPVQRRRRPRSTRAGPDDDDCDGDGNDVAPEASRELVSLVVGLTTERQSRSRAGGASWMA